MEEVDVDTLRKSAENFSTSVQQPDRAIVLTCMDSAHAAAYLPELQRRQDSGLIDKKVGGR